MCVRGSGKGWRDGGRAAEGKSDTRRRRSETLRCCRRRGGAAALATPPTPRARPGPAALPPLSGPARYRPAPRLRGRRGTFRRRGEGVEGGVGRCLGSPLPVPEPPLASAPGAAGAAPAGAERCRHLAAPGPPASLTAGRWGWLRKGLRSARAGLGAEGRERVSFGERGVKAVRWERSSLSPATQLLLRRGGSGFWEGSRA